MPTCKGARLKIERANKHIEELETCIELLKKRLVCRAHVDPNTGREFIKCDFEGVNGRDLPENLALIIGDAIHNLKSALDYVWQETITRLVPSGNWKRTRFPSFAKREELEAALRELKIDISAPNFFAFLLDDIEPHDRGNFAIRTVHKLDLRDKHRLLIPVVHYSSIGNIKVEENGEIWPGFTWMTTDPLPHFVNFKKGIHVKEPGSASFSVMFEYGDAGAETRATETLGIYSRFILEIVELFEAFAEG